MWLFLVLAGLVTPAFAGPGQCRLLFGGSSHETGTLLSTLDPGRDAKLNGKLLEGWGHDKRNSSKVVKDFVEAVEKYGDPKLVAELYAKIRDEWPSRRTMRLMADLVNVREWEVFLSQDYVNDYIKGRLVDSRLFDMVDSIKLHPIV